MCKSRNKWRPDPNYRKTSLFKNDEYALNGKKRNVLGKLCLKIVKILITLCYVIKFLSQAKDLGNRWFQFTVRLKEALEVYLGGLRLFSISP